MKRSKGMAGLAIACVAAMALAACGGDDNDDPEGGSTAEGGGGQGETVWRLAFNQTESHPQYVAAAKLGEDLYEATDGRLSIEVYPNELLGTQSDVIENVQQGSVEMMWVGGPVLEGLNGDFIVFNLPYVFASAESQAAVFADADAVGELFSSLEDSNDITVLTAVYAGSRNVYATSAVRTPADLDGLKIRVQQSDSQVRMIELMGGVASPMGQGEVYTALQSGVLDGAENNETVFNALKHDEVAEYYSYTQHLMIPDYLLVNASALADLDDADRQALLDLIPALTEQANSDFHDYIAESRAASESIGAEFVEDVDVAAFEQLVAPLVQESIDNPTRQALYDAVQTANAAHPGD